MYYRSIIPYNRDRAGEQTIITYTTKELTLYLQVWRLYNVSLDLIICYFMVYIKDNSFMRVANFFYWWPYFYRKKLEVIKMTKLTTQTGTNLVYLGTTQRKSKSDNILLFVKLGDPAAFENFEFMADKDCNIDHQLNSFVTPIIELSNYGGRVSTRLVDLKTVPK